MVSLQAKLFMFKPSRDELNYCFIYSFRICEDVQQFSLREHKILSTETLTCSPCLLQYLIKIQAERHHCLCSASFIYFFNIPGGRRGVSPVRKGNFIQAVCLCWSLALPNRLCSNFSTCCSARVIKCFQLYVQWFWESLTGDWWDFINLKW